MREKRVFPLPSEIVREGPKPKKVADEEENSFESSHLEREWEGGKIGLGTFSSS